MSLAGLDTPAVVEAHQASIADPSGWFLLKYEQGSRDTVEVFKKGTGGVAEARAAIESYPDKSPIYGMAQHKRKKIILKYVPEGTSRLLQVRLTVQFQSIPDAFPHDIVFSFTSASELTEPALGAHTMLAPSMGSMTSSSSSLRKQRLKDISEDAEEGADEDSQQEAVHTVIQPPTVTVSSRPESKLGKHDDGLDDLPASALRAKALLAMRNSPEIDVSDHDDPATRSQTDTALKQPLTDPPTAANASNLSPASPPTLPPLTPISSDFDKDLPAPPEIEDQHAPITSPEASDTTKTVELPRQSTAPELKPSPHLTAGESESISLWSSEVAAYAVKPKKKKLGPRPHVEPPGRPRTSGASESSVRTRPVANLPTTVKVSTDRARVPMSLRPSSQQSSKSVPGRFPSSQSVSNLPPMPSPTHIPQYYRPESRSLVGKAPSLTSEISVNATPEKLRLMKALQMRKRNMIATQRASLPPAVQPESMQAISNGHVVDPKSAPDSTTPTTATIASERAEESSFTSRDDGANRRGSLSSDTSSSITPKAEESAKQKAKPVKVIDPPRRSPKRETRSRLAAPPIEEVDSDNEIPPKAEISPQVVSIPEPTKTATKAEALDPPNRARLSMSNVAARVKKGLSIPNPIHISNTADASGDSDVDSFMDELANATVQEAKPVTVARTPVTPVMSAPALREYGDLNRLGQSGMPLRSKSSNYTTEKPQSSGGRSVSGLPQWPPLPTEHHPQPLTKKSSLGTGISKRIKALEVLSTRDSTSPPRQPVRDIPSKRSAFDTFMKRASSVKPEFNTSTNKSPPKKALEISPIAPRSTLAGPQQAVELPSKGEAVSVTARIIRNDERIPPSTAPGDLNLHRSPLIVEHERMNHDGRAVSRGRTQDGARSPVKQEKGRFSFSSYRSMGQSATQPRLNTADSSSKLSLSSKSKMPRSMSDNSSIVEDKKGSSRAHRLMKRVSNLTGRKNHKNLSSPSQADFHYEEQPSTIAERLENDGRSNSNPESLLHVVDIGDVNVQFPDTLLWKRRFMRIDDQGYLIFSPPANDPSIRNVSRKFHLSDIRTPTLPDLEREQMAWSVFLDMRDGSCIQCACESRAVQQQVLQMLVDAHSAYSQLYGT